MILNVFIFVIILNILIITNSFHYHSIKTISKLNAKQNMKMIVYDKNEPKLKEFVDPLSKFSFNDILVPPKVDNQLLLLILLSEITLVGISFLIADLFQIHPMIRSNSLILEPSSIILTTIFTIPLTLFGLLIDKVPIKYFQNMGQETRFFTLRVLGRGTSTIIALIVSFLISISAGFCEEIAFRGLLFQSINLSFGIIPAFIISSLLFGLAHYPSFGSSTIFEVFFGLVFAYSYFISGYNLAVPIMIHTSYDFIVLFVTWYYAKKDFQQRIDINTEWDLIVVPEYTPLPPQIDVVAKAIYKMIDIDQNGFIDEVEFISGLNLFRLNILPYGIINTSEERKIFRDLDKNKDGKIDYDEFSTFFRDIMNHWLMRK